MPPVSGVSVRKVDKKQARAFAARACSFKENFFAKV